jgi:hypothetical protein
MDVVTLAPDKLLAAVRRLQTELGFDLLLDVTAVDWPERTPRFDVVYHFYSTAHHVRVRVKTAFPRAIRTVDSLVPLYGSAASWSASATTCTASCSGQSPTCGRSCSTKASSATRCARTTQRRAPLAVSKRRAQTVR